MLAKVIAWAPDRTAGARRLAGELARARGSELRAGSTAWARIGICWCGSCGTPRSWRVTPTPRSSSDTVSALSPSRWRTRQRRGSRRWRPRWLTRPGGSPGAGSSAQWVAEPGVAAAAEELRAGDDTYQVEYRLTRDGLVAAGNVQLVDSTADRVVLAVDGVRRTFEVAAYDGLVCVDSSLGSVALTPVERFTDPTRLPADGGWRGRPGHHIRSTRCRAEEPGAVKPPCDGLAVHPEGPARRAW